MKLADGKTHLTYCTNIHPGESWAEVRANIEHHVVAVKSRVAPERSFGVGLRLSARAARELATGGELAAFRELLAARDLYVFTINGFPYGAFHGTRVKEAVYRPDWLEEERVSYTTQLADLLAALLPDGIDGSISTVPGCFRERATPGATAAIARNLARVAAHLADLERRTGRRIVLALEPEPCCMLETTAETAAFFTEHLRGLDHVGVCIDTCHAAVEFEDTATMLAALRAAGVAIAKVQLSAGLRIQPIDASARRALSAFTDDVYLHQVVARRAATLTRYVDLANALATQTPADEWRVHFHVPIFHAEPAGFGGTQDFLSELLAHHRATPLTNHLEVETYTWDVLPAALRAEPVADAIARELRWVLERVA